MKAEKFPIECSDIFAARSIFLRIMHNIKQAGHANIYHVEDTWIIQNYTRKSCWTLSDDFGGFKVPVSKGLITCLAGSAASGFIPKSELPLGQTRRGPVIITAIGMQ